MAIAPPSDILLDAVRAADPAKVRAATARLAQLAADPAAGNEGFAGALASARAANGHAAGAGTTGETSTLPAAAPSGSVGRRDSVEARAGAPKTDTYQKFEAVLLQQFVESMLPKDDELFGDKTSAGVYRSMMAEQFATQLARSGGIGIAKAVAAAHPAPGAAPTSAIPTATEPAA